MAKRIGNPFSWVLILLVLGSCVYVSIAKTQHSGARDQNWDSMTVGAHLISYSIVDDPANPDSPIFFIKVASRTDGHIECDIRSGLRFVDDLCGSNWRATSGEVLHLWTIPSTTSKFEFKDSAGKNQFADIIRFPQYKESSLALWYGFEPIEAEAPEILTKLPMAW